MILRKKQKDDTYYGRYSTKTRLIENVVELLVVADVSDNDDDKVGSNETP